VEITVQRLTRISLMAQAKCQRAVEEDHMADIKLNAPVRSERHATPFLTSTLLAHFPAMPSS